ncbi:MAG TPA: SpoIID/LytB domain-containing protein [bacterium]|nr:SpoIID/LytB domain-containing protein [bacterium]
MSSRPFLLVAAFLAVLSVSGGCAAPQAPSLGEPVRVGQMRNDELHLREIPLERYVAGVLEKEVHASWPKEALKAQAVAARTYVLYRKQKPRDAQFDVLADTSDQVFESDEGHAKSIVRAVLETEGETLEYGGKLIQAFFHSCCGGKSERASRVWPGAHPEPVLQIHDDPYCASCPPAHWTYRIPRSELESRLREAGHEMPEEWTISVPDRDESGRVVSIAVGAPGPKARAFTMTGADFRAAIGYVNIKSTLFEVSSEGGDVVFEGRGSGHGVGLCQWGAKAMAGQGKSYREILEFYYPGAEIVPMSRNIAAHPSTEERILQDLEKSE